MSAIVISRVSTRVVWNVFLGYGDMSRNSSIGNLRRVLGGNRPNTMPSYPRGPKISLEISMVIGASSRPITTQQRVQLPATQWGSTQVTLTSPLHRTRRQSLLIRLHLSKS